MVLLDDLKNELNTYKQQLKELRDVLNIDKAENELAVLKEQSSVDGFWNDIENSQVIMQKIKTLENKIERFDKLNESLEDIIMLIDLSLEEGDESVVDEIFSSSNEFKKRIEAEKLSTLLTGEYDSHNAIISFHAGAGGTEAQDWAEMLYRMYNRWAERRNFKVKMLDYLDGDEAGLKSASILVEGLNAYGFLKSEAGVHRLVRISPFDSSGRRHTS
ncbi:MAG TPA: PCRF domain-containing protein, partial [Clostridiales bacterium]|nr:PCRF domain-containing protein [Clostridiales bacterium]